MSEANVNSKPSQVDSKKSDSTNNQLLSYWCRLFDKPLCSPLEFYAMVEEHLKQWEVPALKGGYLELRESNMFSDKRLYLQLNREKLVFEVCAAPFGSGFFVSSRLFDRRKQATWFDYAVLFFLFIFYSLILWAIFGFSVMVFGAIITLILAFGFVKTASPSVVRLLDERLTDAPWIGPVYDTLLHPLTYFRVDQNNMYQQAVHAAVMATVDELNQKVGIKPLTPEEKKPTIRQLFGR